MQQGRTIQSLASEVLRQAQSKHDYIAGSEHLGMSPDLRLTVPNTGEFPLTDYAHGQLADFTEIPKRHYDRLRNTAPHLLSAEATHFMRAAAQPRMLRTMDGSVRAILSNRYRRIDHFDLLEAVLPQIMNDSSLQVVSSEITMTRLYLKILRPSTETELIPGEPVQVGFTMQNSEVGAGSVSVQPFAKILICSNGLSVEKFGQRRAHIGRTTETTESFEIYTSETLELDAKTFFSKVKDTVTATLDPARVAMVFGSLRESAARPVTGEVEVVVKELSNRFALSEEQRGGVLKNLIEANHNRGTSVWAYANAVTALANSTTDYDEASRIESIGGKIIALPPADWRAIGAAA